MYYKNRKDAAQRLIPLLAKYRNQDGVVLAVPRGGVPIAYYIAKEYRFPLELLMTKKIGLPGNPEIAIGAVSLEDYILDERIKAPKHYIEQEVTRIRESLEKKYKFFMGDRQPADLANKTVIIVDDGIATGNTIISAIPMIRKQQPKKVVVAVPVSPPDTAEKISKLVDDFVCPYTPYQFYGVGYHYVDFTQVPDEEVVRLINELKDLITQLKK